MSNSILNENFLKSLVDSALRNNEGKVAAYIPELANMNEAITAIAVQKIGEKPLYYSNFPLQPVTLQSAAKLVPLIAHLEEKGVEKVLKWVNVEPSGDDFASITRLERHGPEPSNPMLNSGAIMLCSHIPGQDEHQFAWLEHWMQKLFNQSLSINPSVFTSEKRTGDRNRSLAFLMNSRGILGTPVEKTLDLYFALCSYQATIEQSLYLPTLLANLGCDPNTGERIISKNTCQITLSIMATCGLYDETGTHMVRTGMPAKSGVSGYIFASVVNKAGVVVLAPKVNSKGNSIRGEMMLEQLSNAMNWHFAE